MTILKSGKPTNKDKALSQLKETKEDCVRVNFNVPKHFHKQIKQRALDEDITVTELLSKIIHEYLSKESLHHAPQTSRNNLKV